ncbi:MAG TPA: hypothetical protein G4N98_00435 [Thermoflexia bacterium]|nr:hypothetical protein [Thermoflexia bacterium]
MERGKEFEESGLIFTFREEEVFTPEREDFYRGHKGLNTYGVSICDFICLRNAGEELLFIKVKSSAPRKPDEYVAAIRKKFRDSILVYVAAVANRHNTQATNLPAPLKSLTILTHPIRLVLIIRDIKREWLGPLRDSLRKECGPISKIFSLDETQVYNQDLASSKLGLRVRTISSPR